ncbi:MAG: ATPase domain, partial [Bacteroidota bacterium]
MRIYIVLEMSKITQITIENFKSIKNLNHIFKPYGFEKDKSQTTILLGVNESGKSNFLRAIQVLSKGFEGSYDEICYKESQDDEHDILIKGGFIVEDQERFQQLLSSIQLFPEEINKVIKLIYIEKEFSLKANNSTLIAYDFGISILGNRYQFDNK